MKTVALTLVALLALLALPAPALAKVPLNQNQHITDSLVAGRVADVIRNSCSSISAKMFVALSKSACARAPASARCGCSIPPPCPILKGLTRLMSYVWENRKKLMTPKRWHA